MSDTAITIQGLVKSYGEVEAVRKAVGYKKIKFYTQENLGFGDILLPEDTVHTQGLWFTVPRDAVEALDVPQTTLIDALADRGVLERFGVELIGAKLPAIKKAEDRNLFKAAMERIGLDLPRSGYARSLADARGLELSVGESSELGHPRAIEVALNGPRVVVDEAGEGQRLDNFLMRLLKGVPKTHVYRVIRSGEVRINKSGQAGELARRGKGDYFGALSLKTRSQP